MLRKNKQRGGVIGCFFPFLFLLLARINALVSPSSHIATKKARTVLHAELLTQRILESIPQEAEAGGAGGAGTACNTWEALQGAEKAWAALKSGSGLPALPKPFVRDVGGLAPKEDYLDMFDVVVCGGTLGIFIGAALAAKHGLKVAVVERAPKLRGRAQEWNISLQELKDLVKLGVFDEADIDGAVSIPKGAKIARSADTDTLIATHFRAVRAGYNSDEFGDGDGVGFGRPINTDTQVLADGRNTLIDTAGRGKQELWIPGVLNLGIRPDVAIQRARAKLEAAGGAVLLIGEDSTKVDMVASAAAGATTSGRSVHTTTPQKQKTTKKPKKKKPAAQAAAAAATRDRKAAPAKRTRAASPPQLYAESALGSRVFEGTSVSGVDIYDDAAVLSTDKGRLRTRLVIDCMGHASPAVRQVRTGQVPDGVCVVVGTCAGGFGPDSAQKDSLRPQARMNEQGDIIYTNCDMTDRPGGGEDGAAAQQYFWEAFPAGLSEDLRTTYLFTYLDARPGRPSLTSTFEDYWRMLRVYQGIEPDPSIAPGFDPHRALFAFFPTFRRSPLPSTWSRVLHCGDASGIQSPLSFGGFGALTRHLERISGAVAEAVRHDRQYDWTPGFFDAVAGEEGGAAEQKKRRRSLLSKEALSEINPYMPNLAATWMFQKSMSARPPPEATPAKDFVNRLLRTNFDIMNDLGDEVMLPFMQDVVQFKGLTATLVQATVRDPLFIPQLLLHIGPVSLVDWLGHFAMMGTYTALHAIAGRTILRAGGEEIAAPPSSFAPVDSAVAAWLKGLSPEEQYTWKRRAEAWKFGSGLDYELKSSSSK